MLKALLTSACLGAAAAATPPHIVFFLVDDWGWNDVGYHRAENNCSSREIQTPNIDSLVQQGVELDRHYVFKFCSPTRSSLQSGRLPVHVNDLNAAMTINNPKDPVSGFAGIPRNMTGMAEVMKRGGYATHMVGKWDAGMATVDHTPQGRGYDTSLNYFSHANDYYTYHDYCNKTIADLWNTDDGAGKIADGSYEEILFFNRVKETLEAHDPATPLFLFYAFHIVHAPLEVPQAYLDKFSFITDSETRQKYHAMVYYMDEVVGNVTAILRSKGMWDNTLIVSSADNGGPVYPGGGANNYPLKGGKMNVWEGGVRVNAYASGGLIPAGVRGTKLDQYIHGADWYATFARLAGQDPTDHRAAAAGLPPIDSLDVWPVVSGQVATSPRTEIHHTANSITVGDWKIVTGEEAQDGWEGPVYPNGTKPQGGIPGVKHCGAGCLFNVKEDPHEHEEVSSLYPDKLAELQAALAKANQTLFNPDRGLNNPAACELAASKYGGFVGPFVFP